MHDDCREVLDNLHIFLDGECAESLERSLRLHLRNCAPCIDRADFELELRVLVASKCRDEAPDGLLERVIRRISAA